MSGRRLGIGLDRRESIECTEGARTIQAARRSSSTPAASAAAALACVGEEARMDSTQPPGRAPAPLAAPICRYFLRTAAPGAAARGGGYGKSGAELGGIATAASAGTGTTTPCFVIGLAAGRSKGSLGVGVAEQQLASGCAGIGTPGTGRAEVGGGRGGRGCV
jgi:hypothetical protein